EGLTVLADEIEKHLALLLLQVTVAEGGEAKGLIAAGILVVADADQRLLEHADGGSTDHVAAQRAPPEITVDAPAEPRQPGRKFEDVLELGLVAPGAPVRVIDILLTVARIAAGRLDM